MNKKQIISELSERHNKFTSYMQSLNEKDFTFSKENKWTAGQQLDHIFRSVSPLVQAFMLPKFVPGLLFGKANRPSKSYDELVSKYKEKLAAGGVATGQFVPPAIAYEKKEKLCKQVNSKVEKLCKQINPFSEQQLDEYILPHPLLGKLTVREMLYFTMHHVDQHLEITKRNSQE
ncbi:MAG: hypothetical protein POELPBGB_03313 [Bacteroidia bacterium]|nr:hypothetical protein [Bacteroidia bacterium]